MSFGDVRSYCHDTDPNRPSLMELLRSCNDVEPLYAVQYVVDQGFRHQLVVDRWRCRPIKGHTQVDGPFVKDARMYDIHADVWINGHFIHIFDVTHTDIWKWYRSRAEHYLNLYESQNTEVIYDIKPSVFLDRIEAGLHQYYDFNHVDFNSEVYEHFDNDNFIAHYLRWMSALISTPEEAFYMLEAQNLLIANPHVQRIKSYDIPITAFNAQFTQHMLTTKTIHPRTSQESVMEHQHG